jgi:hypothetical protein
LLLAGCAAQVSYTRTHEPPHPVFAKPAATVDVLTLAPSRPFAEMGVLTLDDPALTEGNELTPELTQKLRVMAGKAGCDAIVLREQQRVRAGIASSDVYRATCIVYP